MKCLRLKNTMTDKELPPAIDASLDLVKDLLHPEVFGHAMPDEVKARAFVVKTMLERLKARMETSTWPEA